MSDLAALYPEPRSIAAGGKDFALLPIRVRQIDAFMRALAALDPDSPLLLAGPNGAAAVAVAIGEQTDWVESLPAGEYLALATAVMEVNADFFAALPPAMNTLAAMAMRMAGPTPSASSPQPDTA